MAKHGLNIKTCQGCLRSGSSNNGWALCIGAGASDPIFPRWSKLVDGLIRWSDGTLKDDQIQRLSATLSLESLIQAVFHRKSLPSYQCAQVLSSLLYANFKSNLTTPEWDLVQRVFQDTNLSAMTDADASRLLNILTTKFPDSTPVQIAETLCRAIENEVPPAAILSFNAEPLVLTSTNAYLRCNSTLPKKKYFDVSLRGISYRKTGRVPYHFCHGLLPLPGQAPRSHTASLDKLVFSETEYLSLASSNYSWQSAIFLNTAMSQSLVFVGLSFADPNLRRWLGFVHANRVDELRRIGSKPDASTRHYWINRCPKTVEEQELIEASTAHLGVRLVWIDEWRQTRDALQGMLSI